MPSEKSEQTESKKRRIKKPSLKLLAVILVVFAVVGGAVYWWFEVRDDSDFVYDGDYTRAEQAELDRILNNNLSSEQINSNRLSVALAYYEEDNYERALRILNTYEPIDEQTEIDLNLLYANLYDELEDNEMSQFYYKKVLDKKVNTLQLSIGQDPNVEYELGILYLKSGDTDRGKRLLESYIAYAQDNIDFLEEIERAQLDIALEEVGKL